MEPSKPSSLEVHHHEGMVCSCYSTTMVRPRTTPCAVKLYSNHQPVLFLTNALAQKQTEINQLTADKTLALNNVQNLQEQIDQFQFENDHLKSTVSELTDKCQIFENEHQTVIFELEKQVHELTDQLHKKTVDHASIKLTISDLGLDDSVTTRLDKIGNRIESLRSKSLATLLDEMMNVPFTPTPPTIENDQLKTENDLLKSKVSDLSDKLLILELESCVNADKYNVIFKENNDLSETIKEFEINLQKSQETEIILKKKISDLEIDLKNQMKFFDAEKLKFLDTIESLEEATESLQKENKGLKASQDVLTQKLDKRSQPKVPVPEKIYPIKSFKTVSKRVSQFTNYSLQKTRQYSEKRSSPGTFDSSPFLSFSDNSAHISYAQSQRANRVWKHKQPSVSQNTTHAKSFTYSFSKLFELAPRPVRSNVRMVNDFIRKPPSVFKSTLIPQTSFRNKTPRVIPRWNSTSLDQIDTTYKWFSKVSHTVGPVLKWVPKVVLK